MATSQTSQSVVVPVAASGNETTIIKTDFLIIGAGPAGGTLGCFLGSHGLKGVIISASPSTANTPRAHIINAAAFECIRDIGLEQECLNNSCRDEMKSHTRFCHSFAGREYARLYSWGSGPKRQGDYELASPCSHVDLPQTLYEPIVLRYATQHGFPCRFSTELLSFDDNPAAEYIVATVRDKITNMIYVFHCKYLFGADGARSRIVQQLNLPLVETSGQGTALNILIKADMSHLVANRMGNLHWVLQPDKEISDVGWIGIVRMVKPWNEWLIILFYAPYADTTVIPPNHVLIKKAQELIGDDSVNVELLRVDKWTINEIYAEKYSEGRVFCLGDAVHRHPPMNGLGSNTCIQDAFNLAWKVAYVEKGISGKELLSTYNVERQPVGAAIVQRANDALRDHMPSWEALGLMSTDLEERKKIIAELSQDSAAGRVRRSKFRSAIEKISHEYSGLGMEMNQRYNSEGVFQKDEGAWPPLSEDPILYYNPITYPGARLPHAWLNTAVPGKKISTIDLAGHGKFTLFTGIGGQKWRDAAKMVESVLGVPIAVYCIGYGLDYESMYFDWDRLREVEENGCVLTRPDRFVAWRSMTMPEGCEEMLTEVMEKILFR